MHANKLDLSIIVCFGECNCYLCFSVFIRLWTHKLDRTAWELAHAIKMDLKDFSTPVIRFNGKNFSLWKYQMEMVLEAKMLLIVWRTDLGNLKMWEVGRRKVIGDMQMQWHKCLIGTRIDEQHLEMLINCRTVAHMWIRLAIVHEQDSKENVHIL